MRHILAICPAANAAEANARLLAAGHGPSNFAMPLVSRAGRDDAAPTHQACGIAPEFEASFRKELADLPVTFADGDLRLPDWSASAKLAANVQERKTELARHLDSGPVRK